jgi:hypothetical protein
MKLTLGNMHQLESPTAVSTLSPQGKIATVGIITHNRPAALQRAAKSYAENLRQHGRDTQLMILDDSNTLALREANQAHLHELSRNTAVSISYVGPNERQAFLQTLIKQDIAPPEAIQFALGSNPIHNLPSATFRRTGINRNALLLASVGDMIFSADDDTVCWPGRLSRTRQQRHLILSAGEDPAEKYYYATREEALCATKDENSLDIWAAQEAVLGQSGDTVSHHYHLDRAQVADSPPALAQRLQTAESRIVATPVGLVGDCGLAYPFGFVGTAVGCLYQPDTASHQALVSSHNHYQMATTTRHVARMPSQLALSDGSYLMTTFIGLDNRTLLPPFLPLFRAQDIIWGQTVWRTDPTALIAHMPFALLHDPLEPRRYWPGEIIRSASGYDVTRLVLDCLTAFSPLIQAADRREGMVALGQHLFGLSQQTLPDFAQFVQTQARYRNEQFLAQLEATLTQHDHQPAYWAADVQRYMHTMHHAMQADDYIVPIDLQVHYRPRQALTIAQALLKLFGQLLQAWPDIVSATHDLRQKGQSMARPLKTS